MGPPLFNIWSPRAMPENRVAFDITMADAFVLTKGNHEFVLACLCALGIQGNAASWRIRCVRQRYFSDYPSSEDWRARWDLAWEVEVELQGPLHLDRPPLPLWPLKVDVTDGTRYDEDEPKLVNGPALLIGNVLSDTNDASRLLESAVGRYLPGARVWVTTYCYDQPRVCQIRGLLDPLRFPEDVPALDAINGVLRDAGALMSWLATMVALRG